MWCVIRTAAVLAALWVAAMAAMSESARQTGTTATSASGPATVKVVGVKGMARRRDADADAIRWTPLKVGDEVGPRTIILTGFSSWVDLEMPGRWRVRVGPVTKVGLASLAGPAATRPARLDVKCGDLVTQSLSGRELTDELAVIRPVVLVRSWPPMVLTDVRTKKPPAHLWEGEWKTGFYRRPPTEYRMRRCYCGCGMIDWIPVWEKTQRPAGGSSLPPAD